jgi:phosphate transport system substrate-binding protein
MVSPSSRRPLTSRRRLRMAIGLLGVWAITACGASSSDSNPSSTVPVPEVSDGLSSSARDRVVIAGSTTVEPIMRAVASTFAEVDPDVDVMVSASGTGDGLERLCSGDVALAGASRPIRESEVEMCRDSGIEPVELAIARDGVSLVTSRDAPAASCISLIDLYALIGEDSIGLATWSEIHERARNLALRLGASTDVASDARDGLAVFAGPIEGSGTYATLVDLVVVPISEQLGEPRESLRPDYLASPDDGLLAATTADAPAVVGVVGLAQFEAERDRLTAVAVDAGDGCVEPDPEVVADGRYPLARTLYLYVDPESPGPVIAFVDHLLDRLDNVVGLEAGRVPYVQLSDRDLEAVRQRWSEDFTRVGTP